MKDMAAKAGAGERFVIDSAATSTEELGNPVYPPARRELAAHGVVCGPHTARQMTRADYDEYDLLIGMDSANIRNMTRICGGDPAGKIHRLLDYTARPGDVADPWYTGDFSTTWRDVAEGCRGLLKAITSQAPKVNTQTDNSAKRTKAVAESGQSGGANCETCTTRIDR